MDGKQVSINDQVFDIIYGRGTVVDVDGFVVKFDGHFQRYTGDGWNTTWKRRTLYWSEPLVVAPHPDIQVANRVNEALVLIKKLIEG